MRPPKAYDSRKDQVALTASTMSTTQLGEQAYARVQQALQKSTSPKAAFMAGFAAALTQGPGTGGTPKTSTQPAVSSSKGKGSGFDWTQCKSEVCCPFPCPPSTPHDVSCDFLPGCVCFYP